MSTTSSGESKLAGLDHLRALAIIMVFIFHYQAFYKHPEWVENIGSFGWTGVDLFFVLSGFLIAGQLFTKIKHGKNISVQEFYIKRFFRIIPAYLVVVAFYFSIPGVREKEGLPPLWKFLTFTQNFGLQAQYYGTFSHAWSLCVEEQFYLFLPLIIIFSQSFNPGIKAYYVIAGLFTAGVISRLISWYGFLEPVGTSDLHRQEWLTWMYYPTYNRLDGLLAGISIAIAFNFTLHSKIK